MSLKDTLPPSPCLKVMGALLVSGSNDVAKTIGKLPVYVYIHCMSKY